MDLRQYLFKYKIKQYEAAKEIGVTQVVISNLCNGRRNYSNDLCDRISKWSDGKIKPETLYKDKAVYGFCPTCNRRMRTK